MLLASKPKTDTARHSPAHPQIGHFDLFVVPTMAVAHEARAIAIINRM
jgi:hypothetical protein